MLIEDRARQLRKSIPAAIGELSEALASLPYPITHRQGVERRSTSVDAASEMKLLAASLLAAADAALARLIPPQPPIERSRQTPGPILPRPGSPSLGSAQAAIDDVRRG